MSFPIVETLILIAVIGIFGTAAYASIKAAPWVPVRNRDLERIIALAGLGSRRLVYDLGSGDGRILVALAQNSESRVVGFEISLLPFLFSKLRVLFAHLGKRVEICFDNFLKRDLHNADLVFCFLTPMAMKKLAPKFRKELMPGTRVISYAFSIPGWVPKKVNKPDQGSMPIYVYEL